MGIRLIQTALLGVVLAFMVGCPNVDPTARSVKGLTAKNPYLKHTIAEQLKGNTDDYSDFFESEFESTVVAEDFGPLAKIRTDNDDHWIFSPDRTMAVAINATTQAPGHSLDIYNRHNNEHVERLAYCETPCNYIGVYWLDSIHFAFVQLVENYPSGSRERDGYVLILSEYDLAHNTVVNYQSSRLGK